MNKSKDVPKEWRAAYAVLWRSRQKLGVLQARHHAGLDMESGMFPSERLELATQENKLAHANFLAVARDDAALIRQTYNDLIDLLNKAQGGDMTPECAAENERLLQEARAARDAWEAAYDRVLKEAGVQDASP